MNIIFRLFIIIGFSFACATQKKYDSAADFDEVTEKLKKTLLQTPYPEIPKNVLTQHKKPSVKGQRWCFVGDSGVAELAQARVAALMKSNELKCDRIYHLGDLVYPIGVSSADDPELQAKFLNYHAPFAVPFYFVLGDHEYYSLNVAPWLEIAKANHNLQFPFYFYGHNAGGVCVVAGDTTPFYRGELSDPRAKAQSDWLKKTMPTFLKQCRFKIFIAHHSYATMNLKRRPPEKAYKQPLRTFFEDHVLGKFDLLMSGHDHALAYVGNFKGTDQYISGASGRYTKASDQSMDLKNHVGHKGPGLIALDFENDRPMRAKLKIIALKGDDFNQNQLVFEKTYKQSR